MIVDRKINSLLWAMFFLVGGLFACRVEASDPVDVSVLPLDVKQVDVFLLMGQSNMKGRGKIPITQTVNPRILNMNVANDQWYVAKHPLHKGGDPDLIDGSDNSGAGPGLAFASELIKRDKAAMIALIPAARGGSWIELWDEKGNLYKQAIHKAQKALTDFPSGTARIASVLWLQGESDSVESRYEVYADKLTALVWKLRTDLKDPGLPFIACTIGSFINPKGKYLYVKEINENLLALPGLVPHTACVDARDLNGHIGDFMHYNAKSQEEIGARYAEAYLHLINK